MKLKTTIALVSKQWNAFVRIPLYEFVWITHSSQAKALAYVLLLEGFNDLMNGCLSGSYIRRLHIETPILERCSPADLRTILDYSPNLCMYSDYHSIQRSLFAETEDPRCTPEEILKLVAHPKMRRLSWTSYGDVPFHIRMGPLLTNLSTQLEYLELSSCFSNLRTDVTDPSHRRPLKFDNHMNVCLPSLRALKVSLDNNTFAVLSTWMMPQLENLSVLSSDFSYTGPGFASFLDAHGSKIRQLELGHCSTTVEGYYLTAPQHASQPQSSKSLAERLPNLREFICSADAEWHWQSPDWVAPHILLPTHPTVEFIGIRDIHVRLRSDPDYTEGEPFFPLYTQMCDLLSVNLFPSLRCVRDLSEESHIIRTVKPKPRVNRFWVNVLERYKGRSVRIEDYAGVIITTNDLLRASSPDANVN